MLTLRLLCSPALFSSATTHRRDVPAGVQVSALLEDMQQHSGDDNDSEEEIMRTADAYAAVDACAAARADCYAPRHCQGRLQPPSVHGEIAGLPPMPASVSANGPHEQQQQQQQRPQAWLGSGGAVREPGFAGVYAGYSNRARFLDDPYAPSATATPQNAWQHQPAPFEQAPPQLRRLRKLEQSEISGAGSTPRECIVSVDSAGRARMRTHSRPHSRPPQTSGLTRLLQGFCCGGGSNVGDQAEMRRVKQRQAHREAVRKQHVSAAYAQAAAERRWRIS